MLFRGYFYVSNKYMPYIFIHLFPSKQEKMADQLDEIRWDHAEVRGRIPDKGNTLQSLPMLKPCGVFRKPPLHLRRIGTPHRDGIACIINQCNRCAAEPFDVYHIYNI